MGGSITLTSELGSGTTFKVTFLLAELDAETL
jgi:signal transduction histidine kinase